MKITYFKIMCLYVHSSISICSDVPKFYHFWLHIIINWLFQATRRVLIRSRWPKRVNFPSFGTSERRERLTSLPWYIIKLKLFIIITDIFHFDYKLLFWYCQTWNLQNLRPKLCRCVLILNKGFFNVSLLDVHQMKIYLMLDISYTAVNFCSSSLECW